MTPDEVTGWAIAIIAVALAVIAIALAVVAVSAASAGVKEQRQKPRRIEWRS